MRHMKQAKRVDNGELVQGYYIFYAPYKRHVIYAPNDLNSNRWINYDVDPATVEDVAAKPKTNKWLEKSTEMLTYYCPHCNIKFGESCTCHNRIFEEPNYCPDCGQRLDWSGADGE